MILDDAKFERIEQKIANIQYNIDKGIAGPGYDDDLAVDALRQARTALFDLRSTLRDCIEIEPTRGPQGPTAA